MLIFISPAKTLDEQTPIETKVNTQPELLEHSQKIINTLKKYSAKRLEKLMTIKHELAQLNHQRNQDWQQPFTPENSRQSIFTFKGEVYNGLDAQSMTKKDLEFAQNHLRILSGLYGLLRPLDLMQPYRLEMGTKLGIGRKKNLYQFWGDQITEQINSELGQIKSDLIINLASNEYFKSVNTKTLNAQVIDFHFKDLRNGKYVVLGYFSKHMRGKMARHIIKNKIKKPEDIKDFNQEGYTYNPDLSTDQSYTFTRVLGSTSCTRR